MTLKKVIKLSSLFVAILLFAAVGLQALSAAPVEVAEDGVEWASTTGDDISSVKPGVTANFFVRDDALEKTVQGTKTWQLANTVSAAIGAEFRIAEGTVRNAADDAFLALVFTPQITVTTTITAAGYITSTPGSTPLSARPTAATGAGADVFVTTHNAKTGTFKVAATVPAGSLVTATFNYHTADSWPGDDDALRRAKVVSSSDTNGEWVTISEVESVTSTVATSTTRLFHGSIILDEDGAAAAAGDGKVWVRDGDTLTVNYYNADGIVLDSDTVEVDAVKPVIANVTPADATFTGIENPTVTFDVTDTGSGIDTVGSGIKLEVKTASVTTTATNVSFQGIAGGVRAIFAQGAKWIGTGTGGFSVIDSEAFDIVITATDKAGNSATSKVTVIIDTQAPALTGAKTGSERTAVVLTFSDASGSLDATTVNSNGSDFTVAGAVVTAAAVDSDTPLQVDLTLAADLSPDATPAVGVLANAVFDKAGKAAEAVEVTASDGLKPKITNSDVVAGSGITSLAVKDDVMNVKVVSDERLGSGFPKVTIAGPAGAGLNGIVTMTRPVQVTINEGASSAVVADDTTGQYGVSIQFSDGQNSDNNLTGVTDEKFRVTATSGTTITLANGPIGDSDFDGDVDGTDILDVDGDGIADAGAISFTSGGATVTSTEAKITAVDAAMRTFTLAPAPDADTDVTVTYWYVKDHVFQVDQTAPGVGYAPAMPDADTAVEIQDQSPFIQIIFDEDEYPGDTFKAVTLTKAELTKPDGTTADIKDSFVARTESEYLWASSTLVLGSYTLTISGTDTAGNLLADNVYKFKIAERIFDITLQPGWNLVSVPDSPESSAVNDVFSAPEIKTVITRDRTAPGGWAIAERDASGDLVGVEPAALTTVDPAKGYWVESSGIVDLTFKVPGIAGGSLALPPAFRLAAGWSLVSVAQPDLTLTTRDADEYFSGLDWARAYGYDATTKKFEPILPDPDKAPANNLNLTVGRGYFVYLNKSGTLVP